MGLASKKLSNACLDVRLLSFCQIHNRIRSLRCQDLIHQCDTIKLLEPSFSFSRKKREVVIIPFTIPCRLVNKHILTHAIFSYQCLSTLKWAISLTGPITSISKSLESSLLFRLPIIRRNGIFRDVIAPHAHLPPGAYFG